MELSLLVIVLIVFGTVWYLLPSIIAYGRHHRQFVPLMIVNFFFGWTLLGWVACLAWSFQHYDRPS